MILVGEHTRLACRFLRLAETLDPITSTRARALPEIDVHRLKSGNFQHQR